MKSKYTHNLNNANIILGIHITFKLGIILILFIIQYTTIWVKEMYLSIIKTSIYIQIFIFLTLCIIMIALNNPNLMDFCYTFLNFFYLVVSILELGIIISEIYFMIQNFQKFIFVFHECPYYRTYKEISDLEYKRTCLYYITDYNNELPHKYICYYNSENEYLNNFCDGLMCRKNNNKQKINENVKCYGNVDKSNINFDKDREFYLKEMELINRYRQSNLYACFRSEKLIKDENIFNKKCPDSNPIRNMIIFLYIDIIIHLLIDFLFIYEFILFQRIKDIYMSLINSRNRIPINASNDEDTRNENSEENKQTFNTDNRISMRSHSQNGSQKENSQTFIVVEGFDNYGNIKDIKNSNRADLNEYIEYYEKSENKNENNCENDNVGILKRSKLLNKNKSKKVNINEKKQLYSNLKMEITRNEEYCINSINFIINKKKRNKNIEEEALNEKNHNTNINIDNKNLISIKINDNKKYKKTNQNNINNSDENNLFNDGIEVLKTKIKKNKSNSKSKINNLSVKVNNSFNISLKKELSQKNIFTNFNRNNSGDKAFEKTFKSLKNDIMKNINKKLKNKNKNLSLSNSSEGIKIKEDEKEEKEEKNNKKKSEDNNKNSDKKNNLSNDYHKGSEKEKNTFDTLDPIVSELSLNEESEKNNLKKDSILNIQSEGKMPNLKFTPIINPNIK